MSAHKKTLFIIDGNSLLHRAWHAIPPLTTRDGRVVNAVYGFAMVLEKLKEADHPTPSNGVHTHLAVCWDTEGGTFRDEVFDGYKAGRAEKEQELYDQIPIIQQMLEAHGIASFGVKGFEADDLIATIAKKAHGKIKVVIVTGDLDALQLVNDSVEVRFFVKGLSQTKTYDSAAVQERYGFGPEHIVDYKSLAGDSSDNIPGVKGIGAKTATELIQRFGSVEEIYKALKSGRLEKEMKPAVAAKLAADEKGARMSAKLAGAQFNAPIAFSLAKMSWNKPDTNRIRAMYRDLEFTSLLRRMENDRADAGTPSYENTKIRKYDASPVTLDADGTSLPNLTKEFDNPKTLYALDVRTHAADLFGSTVTAIAVSDGKTSFVYKTPSKKTIGAIISWAKGKRLAAFDLKRILHILADEGLEAPRGMDIMIASYLLGIGDRQNSMDSVLSFLVGSRVPDMPKAFVSAEDYRALGTVVSQLHKAAGLLIDHLQADGMTKLYEEIEHPLIAVLFAMERNGILIDREALGGMAKTMDKEISTLQKHIWKLAGGEFNINSPSQLADVLFIKLLLPVKGIKKTQTGYSTAASELEKIWEEHEVVPLLSEYRELTKLKSTYVDALPQLVARDGRVHTSFNQTVAATGRLSSSDPNVQNIPVRTELGREIRRAFVAPRGRKLLSLDYSQIELRLVAAFSGDKKMQAVFKKGGDIHASTAAEVFGVSIDHVTKDQRRAAKAVNFGIIYGMGPRALSRNIGVTFEEAKAFIEKYFAAFPAVRAYLDESLQRAKKEGYAVSLFGRRRLLPDLNSGMQMLRAAAERMAVNMPLQGSAADIIKKAMVEAHEWLGGRNDARLLLQVHDELLLEVELSAVNEVAEAIKNIMEHVVKLDVPLNVDVEVGSNWRDLEAMEV